ncbi:TetR/AcrR family transcriptional regulator [Methanosphaerula subterraneus]|uniref:TetR/AcrR family transcriptional regulator n=1 Tax=Methanosphaerula subterraneus TaxID=3350244 RepID=UPI003F87366F
MELVITMSFQELIEKEREQRRLYILDTAEELFFAKSFTSVSMEKIAKEVGLNKATLYLYFENKDHLLFAIILRKMKELIARYEDKVIQDVSGREKSRLLGETSLNFARENPEYYRTIGAVGPEIFKDTDNPLVKRIFELLEKQLGMLRDALAEGIADGTVRDDLDPLEMAVYLSLMSTSVISLQPGWQNVLATGGIGFDRFVADYPRFIASAVEKTAGKPESPPAAIQKKTGPEVKE